MMIEKEELIMEIRRMAYENIDQFTNDALSGGTVFKHPSEAVAVHVDAITEFVETIIDGLREMEIGWQ